MTSNLRGCQIDDEDGRQLLGKEHNDSNDRHEGAKLTLPRNLTQMRQRMEPCDEHMLLNNNRALGCRIRTTKNDRKEVWGS